MAESKHNERKIERSGFCAKEIRNRLLVIKVSKACGESGKVSNVKEIKFAEMC